MKKLQKKDMLIVQGGFLPIIVIGSTLSVKSIAAFYGTVITITGAALFFSHKNSIKY